MGNVSVKAIFAGTCACLLLLSMAQIGTSQQAELPTWNVGDTWAMGARDVDLTPILAAIMENLEQMYPDLTYDASGKLSYYIIYKVEGIEAQQYRVSAVGGFEMDADINYSASYQGQQVSASTHMTMVAKMNGTLYYTENELALARADVTLDLDMKFSASGMGMSVSGSADMTGNMSATFDPPLDLFDFPIAVDENWTAESDATITGSISGKVRAMDMEQSISEPLDNTLHVSVSASCPSTVNVTLPDGSTSTCYKIVVSGAGMGQANPLMVGNVLYYSPDQRFVIAQGLTYGSAIGSASLGSKGTLPAGTQSLTGVETEQVLFTMNPVTEQEARDVIAGMGAKGIDIVLLGALAAIVIVVIAVAVLAVRRRRA